MNTTDFEAQTEDRCDNYAMLSRLFREEIDKDLLADLVESPALELTGNETFDTGYRRIRSYLDAVEDLDKAKSELAIDYCLIFLGYGVDPDNADAGAPNAAYPYESVYRTGSKSLGGEHCSEVSDAYRVCMFAPTRERIIAEDHMACELEFMQFLTNSELVSWRDDEQVLLGKTQKQELDFLENHLLAWIRPFRTIVEKFTETEFYAGLLEMTQGWLEMDAEYLRAICADTAEAE